MEKSEAKKSRSLYWIYTILSTAVCIFLVIFYSQFFWIALPFVFTSFMLAMDYL